MAKTTIPFVPHNATDYLAHEIANAFGDLAKLPYYRHICQKFGHEFVYRVFREVMAYPSEKIRKSRRALFHHIINKNETKD